MESHFEAFPQTTANHAALTPLSFIARTADIFPDRLAVIYEERRYTWSETYSRVRRLASALISRGIKQGDTVSIVAPNTPELFEAHYGVPMAGAVLNAINIRLEAETITYILEHSDSQAVLVDSAFSEVVHEALKSIDRDFLVIDINDEYGPGGDPIGGVEYEALLSEGDPDFNWQAPKDEWQALGLNYTSGTSGRPKGVVYHHRGSYLMSMGTVVAWELPRHPVYLYTVPMFHCNGWGHAWTMTLLAGTIVCTRAVTAKGIFSAIQEHNVSHFGGAPIVLSMLIDAPEQERTVLSKPVKVMTAGAPPPPAVLEKTRELGFEVMQVYGLTETFGHVTQALWREEWHELEFSQQAELQSRQGVGFPMTENAAVLNLDSDELVPRDGETQGEIVIAGNTVMKGYYKDLEATQAAFSSGWFRTGDAAVWHENGYIQIKDRLKDVIITGGENVSSVEVEAVLYRHPAVAIAAVVAQPDDKWGEVPCAFVELKAGSELTEDELTEFCREQMAGFKRPKKIIFGALPKTATGKIQKYVLRKQVRG